MNVSAFSFDDSTRAFVSIKMTAEDVKPLPMISEEGEVIATTAKRVNVKTLSNEKPYRKLKYIIRKYAMENITNDELVCSSI